MGRPVKRPNLATKTQIERAKTVCRNYAELKLKIFEDDAAVRKMKERIDTTNSETEKSVVGEMLLEYQKKSRVRQEEFRAVERAAAAIGDLEPRVAFRQFYLEHIPLKQVVGSDGQLLGRSRADYYKNIGLKEFAVNLEKTEFFRKNSS